MVVLLVCLAIVIGVLCYCAKKQPKKRQLSFQAFVYIELGLKTELRNDMMSKKIIEVQRNGFAKPNLVSVQSNPFGTISRNNSLEVVSVDQDDDR